MKTLILVASLIVNAALLVRIIVDWQTSASPRPVRHYGSIESRNAALLVDFSSLRQELLQAGLDEPLIKTMIYAQTIRAAEDSIELDLADYWKLAPTWPFEYALARANAYDRARETLMALYGADAESAPEFQPLFRPLDRRFSFLTPQQQVAVQRIQLDTQRQQAERTIRIGPGAAPAPTAWAAMPRSVAADTGQRALRRALADVLDAAALREYELRESDATRQIQSSGIQLSEPEFRETHRIVTAINQQDIGRAEHLRLRDELRDLIGRQRYTEFWASRDPRFGALARVAAKHRLRDSTTLAVFEIINDVQDQMLRVIAANLGETEQQARTLKELHASQYRRAAGLVDESVAREMIAALAADSMTTRSSTLRQQ